MVKNKVNYCKKCERHTPTFTIGSRRYCRICNGYIGKAFRRK